MRNVMAERRRVRRRADIAPVEWAEGDRTYKISPVVNGMTGEQARAFAADIVRQWAEIMAMPDRKRRDRIAWRRRP